jgi:hypothetical protein
MEFIKISSIKNTNNLSIVIYNFNGVFGEVIRFYLIQFISHRLVRI